MGVKLHLVLGLILVYLSTCRLTSPSTTPPPTSTSHHNDRNLNLIEKLPKTDSEIKHAKNTQNETTQFKEEKIPENSIKKPPQKDSRAIDIERYVSPEFQRNNVFTLPVTSDKYLEEPELYGKYKSSTSSRGDFSEFDLTTPRSAFFDNKFTEAIQKLEQEFEANHDDEHDEHDSSIEHDEEDDDMDHHEYIHGDDEMVVDETDETPVDGIPKNITYKHTKITKNNTADKNFNDFTVVHVRKIDIVSNFNDTQIFSYDSDRDKNGTSTTTSTTPKTVESTRKTVALTKPPVNKNNSYILNNKIETETIKAINLPTDAPNSPENKTSVQNITTANGKENKIRSLSENTVTKAPPPEVEKENDDINNPLSENTNAVTKLPLTEQNAVTKSSEDDESQSSKTPNEKTSPKISENIITKAPENYSNPEMTENYENSTEETVTTTATETGDQMNESLKTEKPTAIEMLEVLTTTVEEQSETTESTTVASTVEEIPAKIESVTQPENKESDFIRTITADVTEETSTIVNNDDKREVTASVEELSTTEFEKVVTEISLVETKTSISVESTTEVPSTTTASVPTTIVVTEAETTGSPVTTEIVTSTVDTTTITESTGTTTDILSATSQPSSTIKQSSKESIPPETTTLDGTTTDVTVKKRLNIATSETAAKVTEITTEQQSSTIITTTTPSPVTTTPFVVPPKQRQNDVTETTTHITTEDDYVTETSSATENIVVDNTPDEGKGKVAAIVISTVGALCLVMLSGLLYVMRKRQKRFNYMQNCRPVSLDDYSVDNVSVYNSVQRRKGIIRASKRSYGNPAFDDDALSHPLNFPALAKFSTNVDDMKAEFEDIPQISAATSELPEGCESKNRYANVIPLPETRVFLSHVEGSLNSDYINANYVTGPKGSKGYYIACQSPMPNTVDDFWRMIWEQNCKVVLMITHLFENGVEKCADYLPPSEVLDRHRLFGDFQVTMKKRDVKEKYIISSLQLKNMVSNSWREITHFWYLGWPDRGVPAEANSLIAFLIEARSYMKSSTLDRKFSSNSNLSVAALPTQTEANPVVVHCSPGTGRTGVVIACDIAIREFEQTRLVDIPKVVYRIRRDRAGAVQTKEQYMFIYKVVSLYAAKLTGGALDSF